ncbi:MAG: hypothetical protein L0Y57_07275 [Beijerinckiaceae bacterium]|nr:hypothetical protein [Beijerinckiaceae bacterium]
MAPPADTGVDPGLPPFHAYFDSVTSQKHRVPVKPSAALEFAEDGLASHPMTEDKLTVLEAASSEANRGALAVVWRVAGIESSPQIDQEICY